MQLAQASIAEDGTKNGKLLGNQKKELNIVNYYGAWQYAIRFKRLDVAQNLAAIAKAGVYNKMIGYSQLHRNTLWKYARACLSIGNIRTPCACDCSSYASVCANLAYYSIFKKWLIDYKGNLPTTRNIVKKLLATGAVTIIEKPLKEELKLGDILVKTGKHCTIIVKE